MADGRSETIIGLDEAGRGPVLGSMFIGGVTISADRLEELEELGLKDSKKLTETRREELGPIVEEAADETIVREVTASEIDELSQIMSLNQIEISAFAEVITDLGADTAYIDLPEPDADRFGNKLRAAQDGLEDLTVVAEHGADDTYPIVSAASIMAKNAREDHVTDLEDRFGTTVGSGYPHDTPTITFLKEYVDEHGRLPDAARTSWSTSERILQEHGQERLDDF